MLDGICVVRDETTVALDYKLIWLKTRVAVSLRPLSFFFTRNDIIRSGGNEYELQHG